MSHAKNMQRIPNLHIQITYIGLWESECRHCIDLKGFCDQCKDAAFKSYIPPMRPCKNYIEKNLHCIKGVVMVLTSDWEEGNNHICLS